jgi:hypothetical protein
MKTTAQKLARKRYLASPNGKAKHQAATLRWRAANREKVLTAYKKHDLKRHYGMTPESWSIMFEAQGRACAVCKSIFPGRKTGHWSTDHDHTTGIVRGILCTGCNVALGQAKDDPQRLRALADYLERKV